MAGSECVVVGFVVVDGGGEVDDDDDDVPADAGTSFCSGFREKVAGGQPFRAPGRAGSLRSREIGSSSSKAGEQVVVVVGNKVEIKAIKIEIN